MIKKNANNVSQTWIVVPLDDMRSNLGDSGLNTEKKTKFASSAHSSYICSAPATSIVDPDMRMIYRFASSSRLYSGQSWNVLDYGATNLGDGGPKTDNWYR
mmetsp:Transcript_43212/g.104488  ORF Transcript_43212/g.104488 Transcript_43212/m.104488 type:complete len:101 (+) Transcript_43212:430-732(+)